jgi:hypothetical protein
MQAERLTDDEFDDSSQLSGNNGESTLNTTSNIRTNA